MRTRWIALLRSNFRFGRMWPAEAQELAGAFAAPCRRPTPYCNNQSCPPGVCQTDA